MSSQRRKMEKTMEYKDILRELKNLSDAELLLLSGKCIDRVRFKITDNYGGNLEL